MKDEKMTSPSPLHDELGPQSQDCIVDLDALYAEHVQLTWVKTEHAEMKVRFTKAELHDAFRKTWYVMASLTDDRARRPNLADTAGRALDVCPTCGHQLLRERQLFVCRSEMCRYRFIESCAGG